MTRSLMITRFVGTALLLFGMAAAPSLYAQGGTLEAARMAKSNKEYLNAKVLYQIVLEREDDNVEAMRELSEVFMALEMPDSALVVLENAFDREEKDGDINLKLGTVYSILGRHDDAIEKLRRAYKYDDESLASRLALGAAYLRMGTDSLDKAQLAILGADKEFPNRAEVKVALGDLYFTQRVYSLSEDYYKEAIDIEPGLIQPRINLGIAYREQGKQGAGNEFYKKALEQFNKVTELAPREPVPWRQQGEIYYLAGEYEAALASYEKYRELRPDDPQTDYLVALAASDGGYYSAATEPAMRLLERTDPRAASYHPQARVLVARGLYSRATTYNRNDVPDSALMFYREAAAAYVLAPDSLMTASDLLYYGNANLWMGDTTRGAEIWRSIVDKYPDSCEYAYKLAQNLYRLRRYDDMLASLDHIESVCGTLGSDASMIRGLAYYQLERSDEAITWLQKAIVVDSTNVTPYYWLANALARAERVAEVPPITLAAVQAVTLPEGDDDASGRMAWLYYYSGTAKFDAGEHTAAIADFKKAVELAPDFAQAYLYLAVTYHTLKDKANACTYYRKTLQYDAGNTTAQKNLKSLGC